MKNNLKTLVSIVSISTLVVLNTNAQKKSDKSVAISPAPVVVTQSSNASDVDFRMKIYKMALQNGDLAVAKQSVYELLALQPERTDFKDSLALLYYNMGANAECILVTRDILAAQPEKQNILELKAIAEQNIGMFKEALSDYEKVYAKSKDQYHLYQIAAIQYELKRVVECKMSVEQLIADKEIDKKEISINVARGQQQKVAFKAAAWNMRGVLAMDVKEFDAAKDCFKQAVALSPDFVLAKGNLEFLEKKSVPAAATKTKPAPKK